jgi:FAD synthase
VNVEDSRYRGMLNIGTRPTVNQNADNRSIEVHILGFEGNLYGKELELEFIEKIREEQKFASIDDLRTQLEKDRQTVLTRLA